jgi:phage shock protein PspC (stress-responsive transcriptional regulator)
MTNDTLTKDVDRPLHRVYAGHIIAGVASGIAEYLDVDVSIVRLGFVVLTLIGGFGVPIYVAAWLFIPEEGAEKSIVAEFLQHHPVARSVDSGEENPSRGATTS